jgi:DNA polymerase III subunit delta'
MLFNTVIGHEQPKRFLQSALQSGRLAHALLFHGEEGIGKCLMAKVLAQVVNCEAEPPLSPPDACGVCRSCHQIEIGAHPDVMLISATSGKGETEQAREIESRFIYRPLIGTRKIVILDNADVLRQEAAKALLKTIEEPPPDSLIILVTARPDAVLPTIRSRCQELRFAPVSITAVKDMLQQKRGLPEGDARFLALVSGGRLGPALQANPEALRTERAALRELVNPHTLEMVTKVFAVCETIAKSDQGEMAFGWLSTWLRDLVVVKVGGDRDRLMNNDAVAELERLAARLSLDKILDLADFVEVMQQGLERNLNKQLMLEGVLLQLRAALQTNAA